MAAITQWKFSKVAISSSRLHRNLIWVSKYMFLVSGTVMNYEASELYFVVVLSTKTVILVIPCDTMHPERFFANVLISL